MHFKKLSIKGEKIKGKGKDDIGKFSLKGKFYGSTHQVEFEKKYKGKHTVHYHGHFQNS